jgi:hypothetical protein
MKGCIQKIGAEWGYDARASVHEQAHCSDGLLEDLLPMLHCFFLDIVDDCRLVLLT